MRHILPLLLFIVTLSGTQVASGQTAGPEKGTLVIVGGGRMGPEIVDEFITTAGGIEAPFVILPTALEGEDWGKEYLSHSFLIRAEAKDVTVLHTRDPLIADTEEFTAPLRRAKAVWIDGGRQWRLADAYLNTRTLKELHAVLERGGVIGGSSAGATIQGDYMVRGAPEGNQIMMAPGHEVGFGFLRHCAIDQHVIARKRHNDLAPVIEAHPDLLGLGIDEGTAVVVQGTRLRVIGDSQVLVHHRELKSREDGTSYETLNARQEYDLAARKVITEETP